MSVKKGGASLYTTSATPPPAALPPPFATLPPVAPVTLARGARAGTHGRRRAADDIRAAHAWWDAVGAAGRGKGRVHVLSAPVR